MSKRKSLKSCEEDLEHLISKVRKLERKILKQKKISEQVAENSSSPDANNAVPESEVVQEQVPLCWGPDDWIPEAQDLGNILSPASLYADKLLYEAEEQYPTPFEPSHDEPIAVPSQEEAEAPTTQPNLENSLLTQLDTDVLQILGENPTTNIIYGPDLRNELACRLQHIATEGLSKDYRKTLLAKYLLPGNCRLIDAPKINLEIKAAIADSLAKRDKGIEHKQKQMASAISCLAEVISDQLNAKEKNNQTLQKLMDAARILCDLQHADSITRRNFITFSLKKDLKDHIVNTKIDSFLFSEGLADALRSAKAVTKSAIELKADSSHKTLSRKTKAGNTQPLNRKAPARRPPGPPLQRNRLPAQARMQAPPPPPPPHASMKSSRPQQPQYLRRQY